MISITKKKKLPKKFYAILAYLSLSQIAFTFISNFILMLNHLSNHFSSR